MVLVVKEAREVKVTLRNAVGAEWRKRVSLVTFISNRRNTSVSVLTDKTIIRLTRDKMYPIERIAIHILHVSEMSDKQANEERLQRKLRRKLPVSIISEKGHKR